MRGKICQGEREDIGAGREGRSVIEEQRERGKICHRGAEREGRSVIEEQGEREDLS